MPPKRKPQSKSTIKKTVSATSKTKCRPKSSKSAVKPAGIDKATGYNTRSKDKKTSTSTKLSGPGRSRQRERSSVDGAIPGRRPNFGFEGPASQNWRINPNAQEFVPGRSSSPLSQDSVASVASIAGKSRATRTGHTSTVMQTEPTKHQYNNKISKSAFKPGFVFSAPIHESDYDPAKRANNPSWLVRREGIFTHCGPVFTKPRKLVVVKSFHQHCIALPIFSHGETGLSFKDKAHKNEFLPIHDTRDPHPPAADHGGIVLEFERAHMYRTYTFGFHVMSGNSTVHVAFPICFRYVNNAIKEGELIGHSLQPLLEVYNNSVKA